MAKRPPTIPDSELDVLKVLWDRGQATVREVLETLRAAGRQWSYATVATLLDRLESKGVVTSDRSELAFVYRPAITTQEVRQKRVNSLVDKLYQGEPGLLVLHLLKSHPLDPGQAKEVRRARRDDRRRSRQEATGRDPARPPDRPFSHGQPSYESGILNSRHSWARVSACTSDTCSTRLPRMEGDPNMAARSRHPPCALDRPGTGRGPGLEGRRTALADPARKAVSAATRGRRPRRCSTTSGPPTTR